MCCVVVAAIKKNNSDTPPTPPPSSVVFSIEGRHTTARARTTKTKREYLARGEYGERNSWRTHKTPRPADTSQSKIQGKPYDSQVCAATVCLYVCSVCTGCIGRLMHRSLFQARLVCWFAFRCRCFVRFFVRVCVCPHLGFLQNTKNEGTEKCIVSGFSYLLAVAAAAAAATWFAAVVDCALFSPSLWAFWVVFFCVGFDVSTGARMCLKTWKKNSAAAAVWAVERFSYLCCVCVCFFCRALHIEDMKKTCIRS